MGSLAIQRLSAAHTVAALASASRETVDVGPENQRRIGEANLLVATPTDEAVVIGAYQRRGDVTVHEPIVRRASGGGPARVGPGSVWVQLELVRVDALVPCDAERILNRYVRPLLRALTKLGATARYFGRDWISVDHRPAALVAFAHRAGSGHALFEAIIGAKQPIGFDERPSYLAKQPIALGVEPSRVADAIVDAYRTLSNDVEEVETTLVAASEETGADPAWSATCQEAIGTLAAGRDREGKLRLGGELMASVDAVARLEERVAPLPPDEAAVGAAVDEIFTAPGVALFGVRALASIRDVIVAAKRVS